VCSSDLTFEQSADGGTTWYPCAGSRVDTGVIESTSGVLTANTTRAWDLPIGGATNFRVRATAWTSGTANIVIAPQSFAYDPCPGVVAQGPTASGTTLLGNPMLMGGTFTTTLPTVTTGQVVNFQTTARGEQLVALSSGGTAAAIKAASTAAAATDPALVVSLSPNSPIVLPTPSTSIISSAATTNATSIKASAGTLYNVVANNTGAAVAYVKLYNLAAAPTVGTSVPALTIPVPAGGSVSVPFGATGARFATGIALAITNLGTDADATAVAAAQVKVITSYA
jgi:hypothetical protein